MRRGRYLPVRAEAVAVLADAAAGPGKERQDAVRERDLRRVRGPPRVVQRPVARDAPRVVLEVVVGAAGAAVEGAVVRREAGARVGRRAQRRARRPGGRVPQRGGRVVRLDGPRLVEGGQKVRGVLRKVRVGGGGRGSDRVGRVRRLATRTLRECCAARTPAPRRRASSPITTHTTGAVCVRTVNVEPGPKRTTCELGSNMFWLPSLTCTAHRIVSASRL